MIDSKRSCLDMVLEGQHFTRLFIVILLRFAGEPVSSLEKLDVDGQAVTGGSIKV
jgi:hypothetical protein